MSLQRIKDLRPDITDYVLHSTLNFKCLNDILFDGFLRATEAIKLHTESNRPVKTIEGGYPAVCFTEQPLNCFVKSIEANYRYTKFAIAVRKDELFTYGGHPVIYGDRSDLEKLPKDLKYLWVTYNPLKNIDWTHEREWRARPHLLRNKQIGLYSDFNPSGTFDALIQFQIDQYRIINFELFARVPIFLPYRLHPSSLSERRL